MDGLLLLCVTGAVKYEARLEVQHVKISKLVVFCVSSAQGHNISRSGRLHIYPSTQPKAKGNFTRVHGNTANGTTTTKWCHKSIGLKCYAALQPFMYMGDAYWCKECIYVQQTSWQYYWNPHIDECSCYPEFQYRAFNKLFSKNCNYVG